MEIKYIHTENIHNTTAAAEVLPYLFNLVKPDSIVDVGCGTGSWLKVAGDLGASRVRGIDGIHVDRNMLCIREDEFLQHNLTLPLEADTKYDLAICLEVAEHLPAKDADNIVKILTDFSNIILFSAGIPGQGGQFHINEQWPEYWQSKFKKYDFVAIDSLKPLFWNNNKVDWWYRQNMILYIKKDLVSKFGFTVSNTLTTYIHPELLNLKLQELEQQQQHISYLENIIETEVTKPRFLPTLKKLIKSITR